MRLTGTCLRCPRDQSFSVLGGLVIKADHPSNNESKSREPPLSYILVPHNLESKLV